MLVAMSVCLPKEIVRSAPNGSSAAFERANGLLNSIFLCDQQGLAHGASRLRKNDADQALREKVGETGWRFLH